MALLQTVIIEYTKANGDTEEGTFQTQKAYDKKRTTKVIGETKRGRAYAHVLSARTIYDVILPADIVWQNREFFSKLFISVAARIKFDASPDWINVVFDGGDEPVEYVQEALFLPEMHYLFVAEESEL